jgi:hypothetical protein
MSNAPITYAGYERAAGSGTAPPNTIQGGGGSANNSPISAPQSWDYVTICGKKVPGLLKSISGVERRTGYQVKMAKGDTGATLTRVQRPPARLTLTWQIWSDAHFVAWQPWWTTLMPKAAAGQVQDSESLLISHPSLDDIGLTAVVCESLSPAEHMGRGLYRIVGKFIEWIPAPKQSVSLVQTITMTNQNPPSTMPAAGYAPPTALQSLKHVNAQLMQALQSNP